MGFGQFLSIPHFQIEMGLLESVVERYHRTSFVVARVGKLVLSLEDMVHLIGLRVIGRPVTGLVHFDYITMMRELVGSRVVMFGPRLFVTFSVVHRVKDSQDTTIEPGGDVDK